MTEDNSVISKDLCSCSDVNHGRGFDFAMKQYYEFIYILDGEFLYIADGRIYKAVSGDLLFSSPYEISGLKPAKKDAGKIRLLQVYPDFTEAVRKMLPDITPRREGRSNLVPMRIMTKYGIFEIFQKIYECFSVKTPENDVMALSYIMQLFAFLSKVFRIEKLSGVSVGDDLEMAALFEFIEKRFTGNLTLDFIAEHMYMDKSYIGRLFKKHTGMTPKAYINLKRTAAAKNMMLDGAMPTDIYKQCGFCEYSTFYRSFKKFTGISPDKIKSHLDMGKK